MPVEVTGVDAVGAKDANIATLFNQIASEIQLHDENIRTSVAQGLAENAELHSIPQHLVERFEDWKLNATSQNELEMVELVIQRTEELYANNSDYIYSAAESKMQKANLELAIKAISKSTQGIQSLLSSQ